MVPIRRAKKVKLRNRNSTKTFVSEYPKFKSLWDIWSVPPVVGDFLFLILSLVTTTKSNIGTTNTKRAGLSGERRITSCDGFQSKIMLINPSTHPTKSVPESPK